MNKIVRICMPNAMELFIKKLNEAVDGQAVWMEGYGDIVDWLTDNKCKGLLLVGGPGVGKTLICNEVLDYVFRNVMHMNYVKSTPFDMAEKVSVMNDRCTWFIDDIGLESVRVNYGNKSEPFVEVVYNAERNGQLLVLTSNMTNEQFVARYGERIIDRLNAIVRPVVIRGESMRR